MKSNEIKPRIIQMKGNDYENENSNYSHGADLDPIHRSHRGR
jgi:hypothetical protein